MTTRASTPTDGRVAFLQPEGLHRNPAFSNVAVVSGSVRTIYVGGQDSVDAEGNIVGVGDIAATEQVLRNLRTALAAAGAEPEHVVKWTIFIVDGQDFRAGYAAFQRVWGDRTDPPVITAAVVKGLAHPDFLVEIDAIGSFRPDQGARSQASLDPWIQGCATQPCGRVCMVAAQPARFPDDPATCR